MSNIHAPTEDKDIQEKDRHQKIQKKYYKRYQNMQKKIVMQSWEKPQKYKPTIGAMKIKNEVNIQSVF